MAGQEFCLMTSRYKIFHKVEIPTRMSDYDYDNDGNRYITSYLHTLEFKDALTEAPLFKFSFPSDVCAEMLLIMYKLITNSVHPHEPTSVMIPSGSNTETIYLNVVFTYGIYGDQHTLTMRIMNSCSTFIDSPRFIFTGDEEISSLINLLEVEQVVDMYVSPSTDRW